MVDRLLVRCRTSLRVASMSGFPGPCPVSLNELLQAVVREGRFQHLSIVRTRDGRYQASFRPQGEPGYKVVIEDDILTAIQGALAPAYGHDWPEVLGEPEDSLEDLL